MRTDRPSLAADLADLEATDPAVARAARALDEATAEINRGGSYRERTRRAIAARTGTESR